jgi:antirestriction protein ArdC
VGASVKKGEKGTMVVFWKHIPQEQQHEKNDQPKVTSILRYYYVFNVAQIDHLPEVLHIPYPPDTINQLSTCDEIIERMPNCPAIKHGKQSAYYDIAKDYINMPKQGSFCSAESYYSTLFHELIHSTGHETRLNRKALVESNGSIVKYSIEELTAEIGACYLSSVSGIANKEFDNSVAYIKGWIAALKNDKRMIVYASGQAQKATDYILQVRATHQYIDENAELQTETP